MQRLLTDDELKLLAAGLTALRAKQARDATGMLVGGFDHAVEALLEPVDAIDNLTALLARDDLNIVVNVSGTDTDAARMVSEITGSKSRRRMPDVGPNGVVHFEPDLASDHPHHFKTPIVIETSHA